jgi:hypothetical protein
MMEDEKTARSRLKSSLLALLQAGAGSLVLATTALLTPAAEAATPSSDSLLKRAEDARAEIVKSISEAELTGENPMQLAFWGNIGRPRWPNWPNGWNNWSRWGNLSRPRWPNWPNGWNNWPNWRNF